MKVPDRKRKRESGTGEQSGLAAFFGMLIGGIFDPLIESRNAKIEAHPPAQANYCEDEEYFEACQEAHFAEDFIDDFEF